MMAWRGTAWPGPARPALARHSKVWLLSDQCFLAWPDLVSRGEAGYGEAGF